MLLDTTRLGREGDSSTAILTASRVKRSHCVVKADGVQTGAIGHSNANNLIAMTRALNSVVASCLTVPRNNRSIAGSSVDGFLGAKCQRCDGLVVALHHHLHLARVVQVQEVEEARQGDRDKMGTRPQAADLLVLDPIAHLEGCKADTVGDVPHLASLVPGGRQQLLTGAIPGEAIHATSVTR